MTTSPIPRHHPSRHSSGRLRRAAGTALLAAALLGTGGTLSAAAAVPAGPSCAQVLARAAHWPGSIPLDGQTYRLHSDAYESYLNRQAPCRAAGA